PEFVFGDEVVEQSIFEDACDVAAAVSGYGAGACNGGRLRLLGITREYRRQLHEALARVDHDLARAERLAGNVGRANGSAASAFGAGIAVEQAFPGQVRNVCGAELF